MHNRYLISGSDYGERKLLLWDAKLDWLMTDPKQFPHIIFWSQLRTVCCTII